VLALVNLRVKRIRYIMSSVACMDLPYFFHIFSYFFINTSIFEKKSYWTRNVCFGFHYNFCLKHVSLQEKFSEIPSKMFMRLHVK